MSGRNVMILAGLGLGVGLWLLFGRGSGGAGTGAGAGGSGAASAGGGPVSNGPVSGGGSGVDDRVHPVRPPIRLAGGSEPDLEGVPAEPAPPVVIADAGPTPSLDDTFSAEKRDAGWAGEHEKEIKHRIALLPTDGVAVEAPECHAHQCRITFTAADDAAIGRFVGHLEEDKGLYGYARMIVLEAVTTTPDGLRRERVYAQFD